MRLGRTLIKYIYYILLAVSIAISTYYEIIKIEQNQQIKNIKSVNDQLQEQNFSFLFKYFKQSVVFVLHPSNTIISHLNIPQHEDVAVYVVIANPGNYASVHIDQVQQFIGDVKNDNLYLVGDSSLIQHYKKLKLLSDSVYFEEKHLCNIRFEEKANLLTLNYKKILELYKKNKLNDRELKSIKVKVTKDKLLYHISYKPLECDSIYLCNSQLYNKSIDNAAKLAVAIYNDLVQSWDYSILYMLTKSVKLEWSTFLIHKAMDVLRRHKILKKSVDFQKYPEVIHMLFPLQFVSLKGTEISYFEIVRFCLSFKFVCEFMYYEEYFDKNLVDLMNLYMPEIYFSDVLTPSLFKKLNNKYNK
ncbi:hypothetical protein COBT_003304 [Conglomerata obtusa]